MQKYDYNKKMHNIISITWSDSDMEEKARQFSLQHHLDCNPYETADTPFILNFATDYTEIVDRKNNIHVHTDFTAGNLAHRQKYGGGKSQPIAKAVGIKNLANPPYIIDATAGLGKDAFVLACLGCKLTLIEQSPYLAYMLNDAINRASESESFQKIKDQGFEIIQGNSIQYLSELSGKPDVIYLDPMFPERKKSALVKKDMQILQKIIGKPADNEELLEVSINCAIKRVVVKRPKGAETLTSLKPTLSFESKKTRYDVYVTKTISDN